VNGQSRFSYLCNGCGRCCHDKVIALAPYDVLMMARAAAITTGDAVRRFTIRRGSLLRFEPDGGCTALDGARCSIHRGRPLACRLYPLGLERAGAIDNFIRLEPAPGSLGVYGDRGTVTEFLDAQGVAEYLAMNDRYRALLPIFRARIAELVDFERVEPREFRRLAVREALAESNFDPNPIIDAMFDPDARVGARGSAGETAAAHIAALEAMARGSSDANALAAAAVLLAVSLGYSPAEAI
jgi:Fe-S-cluster containining protein